MFSYYFLLAVRSLRRSPVITALMIAAIALGIGATMTVYSIFHVMSGDPIPQKSSQLYVVQIDSWGPKSHREGGNNEPGEQLSFKDSSALMAMRAGLRQTQMYGVGFNVTPADHNIKPYAVHGRATYADFFPMFDTPFLFGSGWSRSEDDSKAAVVVISKKANDKLFGGSNSVGKQIQLDGADYRIVGVLDSWNPRPRFYDVITSTFGETEDVFLPLTLAVEKQMQAQGNTNCNASPDGDGFEAFIRSECVWTQFWVELPTAADAEKYRTLLDHYALEQKRLGRFTWEPNNRLRNVREWLDFEKVVPQDTKVSVLLAFSFLLVCLINTVGLMLAKFLGRSGEIGLRRAVGATRSALFAQCLVECGVIGLVGGLFGLLLTALGLLGIHQIFPKQLASLAQLDPSMVALTIVLAVVATMLSGLYPTFRAIQVQPAWQLKSN